MREYIVQYERKHADNPKDKCDLCNHAIVGELVRCKDCHLAEDDIMHMYCVYFGHKVCGEDYCSNAVGRKEDSEVEE